MFSARNGVYLLVVVSLSLCDPTPPATPQDCQSLVTPLTLDNHGKIEGRWTFIEGFADQDSGLFFGVDSSWVDIKASPEDNITYTMMEYNRVNGTCETVQIKTTPVSGSDIIMEMAFSSDPFIDRGTFLSTCVNCLLLNFTSAAKGVDGPIYFLHMYVREGSLKESDRQVFHQQAKCLNLSPPAGFHYNPKQDFCAEDNKTVIV